MKWFWKMFSPEAWHRRRLARAKAACEYLTCELCGRAAVREAEYLVEAAWIDDLDRAERADPTVRQTLEREREAFARATRRREAEAEHDRRRLAAVNAEMAQMTRSVSPEV